MKKIFVIIFLFFFFFINIVNVSACSIDWNSSPEFNNYLQNLRKILTNIWNEAKKAQAKNPNNWKSVYSYWIKLFNDSFSFSNYQDEINFSVFYRKLQEVPKQVERDYKKLSSENNYIKEIWVFISENNLSNIYVSKKDICSWIINCSFDSYRLWDSERIWDFLSAVAKNHENIKSIFVKITAWKEDFDKREGKEYYIINPNFFLDIKQHYWPENMSKCSKESWFFKKISEETTKIFNNQKSAKEWVKEWKKAWALLTKVDSLPKEEYEALEKDLLKKELQRQWVSMENQKNVLNNLEKYNQNWWYSKNNNFITNTFTSAKDKFKNTYQELKQEVVADFFDNYARKTKNKDIPTVEVLKAQENSNNTKSWVYRLQSFYQEYLPYTSISETNNENLENRIINTHIELSNSINTLIDTCKMAVKICNQQDAGNGKCWDCNW